MNCTNAKHRYAELATYLVIAGGGDSFPGLLLLIVFLLQIGGRGPRNKMR